jgi:hypothetical protein
MYGDMHAEGEVVSIKEEMTFGKMETVYTVSEGNGARNMEYVPESKILTILKG